MVCRFLESFDYYTSDTEIARKWTVSSAATTGINNSVQRTGLGCGLTTGNGGAFHKIIDDQATWIVGFAFRADNTITTDYPIVSLWDNGTIQMSLNGTTSLSLEVVRGTGTAVASGESANSILKIGSWQYIELKVTIANSIGASTCQVYLNGELVITVDTAEDLQSTANATADELRFKGNTFGTQGFYDDLYIFDGTGAVNNDFAGDSKVVALHPDGSGTTSDFTGTDADSVDNYLHVDETDTDDDTSYVESSTVGHIDLYTFGDLPDTPSAIHAVQVNAVFNKQDAGARTMRVVTRPTAANFFSPSITPSTDYLNKSVIYDEDPNTAGAWGEAALNATEFGVEIET